MSEWNQTPPPFRPKGSNAEEWHLWLSYYADSRAAYHDVLSFLAVQIAEAIDRAAVARPQLKTLVQRIRNDSGDRLSLLEARDFAVQLIEAEIFEATHEMARDGYE